MCKPWWIEATGAHREGLFPQKVYRFCPSLHMVYAFMCKPANEYSCNKSNGFTLFFAGFMHFLLYKNAWFTGLHIISNKDNRKINI